MHGPTQLRRWSGDCREILDHITSVSSHVTIYVYLLKKRLNRQWSELFPAARVLFLFLSTDMFLHAIYVSLIPQLCAVFMLIAGPRGQA